MFAKFILWCVNRHLYKIPIKKYCAHRYRPMNVPYIVKPTPAFGGPESYGLFAQADIAVGTLIWQYQVDVNVQEFDSEFAVRLHLASLPTLAEQQGFLDVSYSIDGANMVMILDDGRYMNHASSANCKTDLATGHVYTIKNILNGAQLLEDYATFVEPAYLRPLLRQFDCEPTYY